MDINDLPDDPDDDVFDLDAAADMTGIEVSTRGVVPGFEAIAQAASAQVMGSFSGLGAAMGGELADRVGGMFAQQVGGDFAKHVGGDVFSGLSAAMGAQASGALLERIRPAAPTAELIGRSAEAGRVWSELASSKNMLRNVVDCSEVITGMSAALGTNSAMESMREVGQSRWVAEAMKKSEFDFLHERNPDLDAVLSGRVADPWLDDVIGGEERTDVDDVLRGPPVESFTPPLPPAFVRAAVDQDVQVPDEAPVPIPERIVVVEKNTRARWMVAGVLLGGWDTVLNTVSKGIEWVDRFG